MMVKMNICVVKKAIRSALLNHKEGNLYLEDYQVQQLQKDQWILANVDHQIHGVELEGWKLEVLSIYF